MTLLAMGDRRWHADGCSRDRDYLHYSTTLSNTNEWLQEFDISAKNYDCLQPFFSQRFCLQRSSL